MEWAISLPNYSEGKHIDALTQARELACGEEVYSKGIEMEGKIEFTRLYFGQEFCERLLPTTAELSSAFMAANQQQLEFSLVTPYVTEQGLQQVAELLCCLAQLKQDCEVVVNDWGVLHLLHSKHPQLKPVLGRMLNKVWRDPRILRNLPTDLRLFQTCSLSGKPMQALLCRYGVQRVEIDYPPQGLDPELDKWGFSISLYLPFGCITTGRMCLLGAWGLPRGEKFKTTNATCSKACRSGHLELTDASGQIGEGDEWMIVQWGNSVFYHLEGDQLGAALTRTRQLGVERIIVQSKPL
ncbi:MAG: hypothetical protein M0Z55_09955 [Peptococcaceae bacterium]|nr:hypothetical protein [Peptococcaceae bacterium]